MNLYFTIEFRTCLDLFSTSIGLRTCSSLICNASVQFQKKIRKISRRRSLTFSEIPRTWSFHVVVLERTAKKCTKNYNARAQLLFCSLNLLFCGVLVAVAVAVVVCLRSLFNMSGCSHSELTTHNVLPMSLSLYLYVASVNQALLQTQMPRVGNYRITEVNAFPP